MSNNIIPLEEAHEQQRNIIKFHLGKLAFKKITKEGVEGIDLNSAAAIHGLCTHFDYIVNYTSFVCLQDVAPFINQLTHMMKNNSSPQIIDFLLQTLGPLTERLGEKQVTLLDNIALIEKALEDQGWRDDMM